MRSMSIGTKISLIVIGIILVLAVSIALEVQGQMKSGIQTFATDKAKSDLGLADLYLNAKYPGDWQIIDGELYKGDTKMNDNFDVVDEIGKTTSDTVTVFQNDTRVATNVMNQGKRAIGTKVSDAVAAVVLKQGKPFYGEAIVVGHKYQAAYEPIKNAKGEVVGIFYVGASQDLIDVIITKFRNSFLWMITAGVVIATLLVLWYMRSIRKRLGKITAAMEQAGAGNFTTLIADRSRDEIGKLGAGYNQMRTSLGELIQRGSQTTERVVASANLIRVMTERTTQASNQVAASIEQVADGADHQRQSTTENLRAMEEMAGGIQSMAESAADISESAYYSKRQAESGGRYMHQTVQQMVSIDQSVHETDAVVRSLNEKSRQISGILEVIREISAQTNLLALNAAIEAARAGESGRGFAVVASEVRKLAEQSGQSSDQIGEMIQEIEKDMQRSIASIAQVLLEVQAGVQLAKEADRNFSEIVRSNGRIAERIEGMAASAEQMSAGIEQITASVTEIARITQTTSQSSNQAASLTMEQIAAIEEIASSAVSLSEVSDELKSSLGKFRI